MRAHTTRERAASQAGQGPGPTKSGVTSVKPSPASSSSDLALKSHPSGVQHVPVPGAGVGAGTPVSVAREKSERTPNGPPVAGAGAANLAKAGQGVATPRRREKKATQGDTDIVKRLQAICTDADPTRLYRNLVKIGQGYVASVLLDGG